MFSEYIQQLRASGRRHFTSEEIRAELQLSDSSARSGLYRLKRDKKVISPINGLYVIVPPEYQSYGSIPAEELVPIIMQYLQADYYVGLLSAGLFYGATHQKPARFQVITNKRIKHCPFSGFLIRFNNKTRYFGYKSHNFAYKYIKTNL